MRPPGLGSTVKTLLTAVAVVGLDLALIRGAYLADQSEPCTSSLFFPALIFVLPLSLLAVAAVNAVMGIARRGWASSFATGYLLIGGLTSLVVSLDDAADLHQIPHLHSIIEAVFDPSLAPGVPETLIVPSDEPAPSESARELLLLLMYSLPQVLFAIIGGCLASRCNLAIALRGPGLSTPASRGPIPTESQI